jgi:ABC-2 type transport system permease protein
MLWYKAWRESRTRFAIIAFTLIGFCLFAVLLRNQNRANGSIVLPILRSGIYSEHIYNLIYGTAKGVFAILTIFLGLGGLLRERRNRTAIFTLSLPVSRLRLIGSQLVVGMVEMAVLSLLPALLIPSLSMFVHESYPLAEALHFSMLWFACGSIIFATAFLMSSILGGGEYAAPVVCYVALMLQALIMTTTALGRRYRLNLMWTMGEFGRMHWDSRHKSLASDPLPWARLAILMLIALCMLALASRIASKQDF